MRKLAWALLSFSAAVFVYAYFDFGNFFPLICAVLCAAAVCGFFLKGDTRLKIMTVSIAALCALLYCRGYDAAIYAPARDIAGTEMLGEFEITSFPAETDSGVRADALLDTGKPLKTKVRLYLGGDGYDTLKPGDKVSANVRCRASDKIYGRDTDVFTAKGIVLLAYADSGGNITPCGKTPIKYMPLYFAEKVKAVIKASFTDYAAPFATAILTGDTSDLYDDGEFTDDLKISGVYHIVAVSGMHISFLVALCTVFTGNRRRRIFILTPIVLIFMAMSGFRPSVTRAGIMFFILLLSSASMRESDSITSLSIALGILLVINPYSCRDIGLQLSFAAMLGIILIGSPLYDSLRAKLEMIKRKRLRKALCACAAAMTASVGAAVFTMPLNAYYFGYISLVGVVTNMLIFAAVSLMFTLSFAVCAVGAAAPGVALVLSYIPSAVLVYIRFVVKLMAGFRFSALYTSNILVVIWLFALCGVIIFAAVLRPKPIKYITPVCTLIISLCVILIVSPMTMKSGTLTVTALNVGQGSSTVISDGNYTLLIDCGSSDRLDAGSTAAGYLSSRGITKIDMLILTHYHIDHANGIEYVIRNMKVGAVLMPEPLEEDEAAYNKIVAAAEKHGTKIEIIYENTTLGLNESTATVFAPIGIDDENERGLTLLYTKKTYDILITGDAKYTVEEILCRRTALPDIEVLIAGHHGSKYSNGDVLLNEAKPDIAVISVGENSYGHPSRETLERFSKHGIEVHRTDIEGNVKIALG